jgi:soluble lytic murein transglycosylase
MVSVYPPKSDLPPPPSPYRGRFFFITGLAVVAILVYSGTAWLWLRPAIYKELVNKYAGAYGFDPLLVMSIIRVESSFARSAHSPRGAMGLMQLLPTTAREIAPEVGRNNFQDEDLHDPEINVQLGVHYLYRLQHLFPEDDVALLAAYNAGPGITQQWRKGKPVLDLADIPYKETRRFVRRVQVTYTFLKSLQRWKHLFGING